MQWEAPGGHVISSCVWFSKSSRMKSHTGVLLGVCLHQPHSSTLALFTQPPRPTNPLKTHTPSEAGDMRVSRLLSLPLTTQRYLFLGGSSRACVPLTSDKAQVPLGTKASQHKIGGSLHLHPKPLTCVQNVPSTPPQTDTGKHQVPSVPMGKAEG